MQAVAGHRLADLRQVAVQVAVHHVAQHAPVFDGGEEGADAHPQRLSRNLADDRFQRLATAGQCFYRGKTFETDGSNLDRRAVFHDGQHRVLAAQREMNIVDRLPALVER